MTTPIRRNKHFDFDLKNVNKWHQAGPGVTQFFNAMSLFFPEGERYFIRSVRAFSERTPATMKEDISAFIGQEAIHGREHERMNEALKSEGFSKLLRKALSLLSKRLPDEFNLAATIALEHITAILAQGLLEDVQYMIDSDENFRDLWLWHALEETEHKSVAFDQYEEVVGFGVKAYVLRCFALVVATVIFMLAVAERYFVLLYRNKQLSIKNIASLLTFLFSKPGTLRKAIPRWFDWFRFDFHPWDHDNSHELSRYRDLLN